MARRQAPRAAAPAAAPPKRGLISAAVGKLFDTARAARGGMRTAAAQAKANFPWAMPFLHPVEALDPRFKMPSVAAMGPSGNARYARQTINLARHAYRNDGNISRGIAMVVAGIVGTGPLPCSPFPELQAIIRQHLPDIHGRGGMSWGGVMNAIATMEQVDGEVFVRLRPRRLSDGLVLPLQIELKEAEEVIHEWTKVGDNGNRILNGIEIDSLDRPVGYWCWPIHPGDAQLQSVSGGQGMPEWVVGTKMLHVRKSIRPNSWRGDSRLAAAIIRLFSLHNYQFAEDTRKHVSTLVTGWITRPAGEEGAPLPGEETNPDPNGRTDTEIKLEAGILTELPVGTEIKWNNPPDTGQSYEPYVRFALQYLAACCGSTYEDFTGDWRGANDRTWRAAQVAMRQFADVERDRLEKQFLRPLYRQLVDLAIALGLWTPPAGTPDWKIYEHRWSWAGFKAPNQYQENNAALLAIQSGTLARDEFIESQGGDPVELDRRNAEGKARAEAMGLHYTCYAPAQAGAAGGLGAFFEGLIGGLVKAQVEAGLRERLADAGGTEMEVPKPEPDGGDGGGPGGDGLNGLDDPTLDRGAPSKDHPPPKN